MHLKILNLLTALAFTLSASTAQELPSASEQDLKNKLKTSKPDTAKVNLLVALGDFYFLKPGSEPTDLHNALGYAQQADVLSTTLGYKLGNGSSYELMSNVFHTQGDTAKGKFFAKKAVDIFQSEHSLSKLGDAYFDLAGYYSFLGSQLPVRISFVEKALHAFHDAGYKLKEADMHKELGDLKNIQQDYEGSLTNLREALNIYQSIHHRKLHGTYDLMGNVMIKLGDFEQALKYGLLAVKTAEEVNDTTLQLATVYNRVGIIYSNLKEFETAFIYLKKGFAIGQRLNDTPTVLFITANLSKCFLLTKQPEESLKLLISTSKKYPTDDITLQILIGSSYLNTYMDLKKYESAQLYCDELIALSKRYLPNGYYQSAVFENLIQFFIETKQIDLARKYLATSYAYAASNHIPALQSKNYLSLFKLDSMEGKYSSAIAQYQQFKVLEDSLLNEVKSKSIEQLQIEFETEKKDQHIKSLGKQNQLQLSLLKQEGIIKKVIFGGFVLLLIIVGLLVYQSRHRAIIHKVLVKQQTEIQQKNVSLENLVTEKDWLLKEIHHRVKNNFHMVIGLLGTQSQYLKNEEALVAMEESQHRVHAMSLVHQKLYQSENMSATNMPDYIYELVDYFQASFQTKQRILFDLQVERIELDLAHSLPIGLILNEAITNSIKYGFPNNKDGTITIVLKHKSENDIQLIIKDNGVGIPDDFDHRQTKSMGTNLMRGLSGDIGGTFTIGNNTGTQIEILFRYDPDTSENYTSASKLTLASA